MTLAAYTRGLNQVAVYWPPGQPDGLGGRAYGTAVEIRCRWQNVAEVYRSSQGEELTSSSVVYPDRVLEIGGFLALGSFEDDITYTTPGDVDGSREIRQVSASPSLRADKQINKVYL